MTNSLDRHSHPGEPSILDSDAFEHVVRWAPLCAIDLVITDPAGSVLLGLRRNEPASEYYFVPGGRVRKGERLEVAFRRILWSETAIEADMSQAIALGVFEHFYDTNALGKDGFGTHYICLAYQIELPNRAHFSRDSQHKEMRWIPPYERSQLKVHPYAAAYLDQAIGRSRSFTSE
ncbi:NUDIX domain-containing protein [uncultured Bradyrhizobium sp.]|uniref:NUDIX domain-containing protein n=1 Tax=uncultured Bradyrhizobium sp. TaxID=199684 RepID=UPI002617F2E6|nr:NUDIX domain-containing protein [uncultured Bradyrhizobium sp.]